MGLANDNLFQALRRLLRPIVRLLIQKNVTLQVLADILKETYVSVAEETLQAEISKKVTDSHISLMTGVHRKDVKKYRNLDAPDDRGSTPLTIGAEVIARWAAQERYVDKEGEPLPLPYTNKECPEFSFTALADSVSKVNIRANVLLEEFLRLGMVEHNPVTDFVTLKKDAYIPDQGQADQLYYFGANGADHLAASVNNILSGKTLYFDRSVYHDGLTRESVEILRSAVTTQAMKTLKLINKKAFELSEKDKGNKDARFRINLGSYFFTDTEN